MVPSSALAQPDEGASASNVPIEQQASPTAVPASADDAATQEAESAGGGSPAVSPEGAPGETIALSGALTEDTGELVEDSAIGDPEATALLDAAEAAALGTAAVTTEGHVELDGTTIESITVKWLTPDTEDDGNDARLSLKPTGNADLTEKWQLDLALSGEFAYEAGDIVVTIPAVIWKNRAGEEYGYLTLSVPEDPESRAAFNYRLITDGEGNSSSYIK